MNTHILSLSPSPSPSPICIHGQWMLNAGDDDGIVILLVVLDIELCFTGAQSARAISQLY